MSSRVKPDSPIGIFDSGVGGLTVLRAVRSRLPHESLIYLGDTARVPYGTKSPLTVQRYAEHAAAWLVERGIKLLVVACNTASALALDTLREQFRGIPVIGVVEPGATAAVRLSRRQHHLVLATEATTSRLAYTRAILAQRPDAIVEELPCSLLVALAEEGWHTGVVADSITEKYLGFLRQRPAAERPDTAILGCTHFPLLHASLARALGDDVQLVDSATTTAEAVFTELHCRSLLASAGMPPGLRLVATDGAARFARVGSAFLGADFAAADIELTDIHVSHREH